MRVGAANFTVIVAAIVWQGCETGKRMFDDTPLPNNIFTVAVIPDTQGYTALYPDIFSSQTLWLAKHVAVLNLEMVIHIGDLVEGSWVAGEWETARQAMGALDGIVPYVVAPGNHDYGAVKPERNARRRTTLLHEYFPLALFQAMPTYAGSYGTSDRVDNTFHTFSVNGTNWLVLALEFGPRNAVIDWARGVLAEHPDHLAIVNTHAYLFSDDTRYDWAQKGNAQEWNPHAYGTAGEAEGVNDGQELWNKLIEPATNVCMVLCGHVLHDGLGYRVDRTTREVHQILANYQMNDFAGEGYLRLMHFNTQTGTVAVETYSPWLDEYKTDPANQFSFHYDR